MASCECGSSSVGGLKHSEWCPLGKTVLWRFVLEATSKACVLRPIAITMPPVQETEAQLRQRIREAFIRCGALGGGKP